MYPLSMCICVYYLHPRSSLYPPPQCPPPQKYLTEEGLRAEHFSGGVDTATLERAVRALRR